MFNVSRHLNNKFSRIKCNIPVYGEIISSPICAEHVPWHATSARCPFDAKGTSPQHGDKAHRIPQSGSAASIPESSAPHPTHWKQEKQHHFPNPIKCSRGCGVDISMTKATPPPEKGHGAPHHRVQCRLTGQRTSGHQDRQLEIPLDVPVFYYQCTNDTIRHTFHISVIYIVTMNYWQTKGVAILATVTKYFEQCLI